MSGEAIALQYETAEELDALARPVRFRSSSCSLATTSTAPAPTEDYRTKFEVPVQAVDRSRRHVPRGAWQPRPGQHHVVRAVQHERPAVLRVRLRIGGSAVGETASRVRRARHRADRPARSSVWLEEQLRLRGRLDDRVPSLSALLAPVATGIGRAALARQLEPLFVQRWRGRRVQWTRTYCTSVPCRSAASSTSRQAAVGRFASAICSRRP